MPHDQFGSSIVGGLVGLRGGGSWSWARPRCVWPNPNPPPHLARQQAKDLAEGRTAGGTVRPSPPAKPPSPSACAPSMRLSQGSRTRPTTRVQPGTPSRQGRGGVDDRLGVLALDVLAGNAIQVIRDQVRIRISKTIGVACDMEKPSPPALSQVKGLTGRTSEAPAPRLELGTCRLTAGRSAD